MATLPHPFEISEHTPDVPVVEADRDCSSSSSSRNLRQ